MQIGILAVIRDITEQKRIEKKLEEYSEGLELTVEARTRELKEAHERLLRAFKILLCLLCSVFKHAQR